MSTRRLLLALSLVLAPAHVTMAQAPSDASAEETPRERGVRLFQEAAGHYRAGRFRVAVELLRESYELHPEPVVMFNLARSLEGLGEFEDALASYRRFLDEAPDAPDRGAVQTRIATLSRLVEEERAREAAPPAPAPPAATELAPAAPAPPPDDALDAGAFVFLGLGGAGLVAGGVLAGVSVATHDEWVTAPSHESAVASLARAQDFSTAANVAFVAGGVLAAIGAIWLVVDLADGPADERAPVQLGVGPGALDVRVRF